MNLREIIDSQQQDKGVGDTVKRVTEKLGLRQCGGCKKRQEYLNRRFAYQDRFVYRNGRDA